MKGYHPPFDPELEEVLVCGRAIGRVPDVVRARALARARATVAAAAANPPEPARVARRRGFTIAWAAAAALIAVTAGAVAALRSQAPHAQQVAPPSHLRAAEARVHVPALDSPPASPTTAPQVSSAAKPQGFRRPAFAQESYAAELELLSRAQVAYAGRDFSDVLALVAEHRRRFPNGRLAEEREALRVRALAGSGRTDEARRAVGAFADRFPRSVFLPRLGKEIR
jgi:hypothetical protein